VLHHKVLWKPIIALSAFKIICSNHTPGQGDGPHHFFQALLVSAFVDFVLAEFEQVERRVSPHFSVEV